MDNGKRVFTLRASYFILKSILFDLNPEWPHRQGDCLLCRLRVRFKAEASPICKVQVALRDY